MIGACTNAYQMNPLVCTKEVMPTAPAWSAPHRTYAIVYESRNGSDVIAGVGVEDAPG